MSIIASSKVVVSVARSRPAETLTMAHPHMSTTILAIVLAIVAILFYAAFVLYGAWIDGKRQKIREKGQQPVTESTGEVHAKEEEQEPTNGNHRSR